MPKDFAHLPHTVDERLDAAFRFLSSVDKQAPSADALAMLTGVDVERVRAWLGVNAGAVTPPGTD